MGRIDQPMQTDKHIDTVSRLTTNLATASIIGFVAGITGHGDFSNTDKFLLAVSSVLNVFVSHIVFVIFRGK